MQNLVLALTAVAAVASAVNSSVPVAAYSRTGDARFLLVSGAALLFLVVALCWAYGAYVPTAPSWTSTTFFASAALALASVLLLLSGLVPSRSR